MRLISARDRHGSRLARAVEKRPQEQCGHRQDDRGGDDHLDPRLPEPEDEGDLAEFLFVEFVEHLVVFQSHAQILTQILLPRLTILPVGCQDFA